MIPDLNATALFVQVVQNKSFSRAANCLGVPISTVSRKISELERALGVRLLERSTRKLRLTELGEEFYGYCQRGLEELEAGASHIQDKQTDVSGTLRLSAPPNLADVLIAPLLCNFQAVFPKVNTRVLITERNLDLLVDPVDVAFRVGKLSDSNLIARKLIEYRHRLVTTPEYLADAPALVHPRDLSAHRLITFDDWQTPSVWKLHSKTTSFKVKPNPVLSMNDYAGIIYSLQRHQGIAEIPAIICQSSLDSGEFIEILPEWRFAPTRLSLVYPCHRNLNRTIKCFIDFCLEHTAGILGLQSDKC